MDKEKHKKILTMLAEGNTAIGIGANLGLSPRTIERHIEILKVKHGAKNVVNLVHIAHKQKLIR